MTDPSFYVRAGQTGANLRGTPTNVLTFLASQRLQGQPGGGGGGAVSSVFTRAGAVVAQLGDYAASLVTNDSSVAGATVRAALNTLLAAIPSVPVASVFGRIGAVAAALNDYAASLVNNDSTVAGATVKDALNALLAGNLNPRTVAANFNFAASDAGRLVLVNSAGAVAGTIPTATFAVGDVLLMMVIGAFPGESSFVAGGGETMLPNGLSNKTFSQYALIACVQVSLHNWVTFGNVALL